MPQIRTLVDYPIATHPPRGTLLDSLGEEVDGMVLVEWQGGQLELLPGHWEWVGCRDSVVAGGGDGSSSEGIPVWLL